ncbi:MAG: hypothetical protein AAGL69_00205 [Pseudomonadota bacterium]
MRAVCSLFVLASALIMTGCVVAVGDDSDDEEALYTPSEEVLIEREIVGIGATWCCASCTDPDDGVACESCRRDAPEQCRAVEVALSCTGTYTERSPGTQNSVVTCLD